MRNFIRDYFTFNRRERNGVLILTGGIFLLLVYLTVSKYFVPKQSSDLSGFEKQITQFEESQKQKMEEDSLKEENNYSENEYKVPVSLTNPEPERFDFDPNHLPGEDWKRLGLSDKQIHVIKNYEAKGGKFRKKEDLKKMYCISAELYTSLEPYIKITAPERDSTLNYHKDWKQDPVKPKKLMVELNTADSVQLDQLRGIGFSFAKRIIKYRNMLGGFASVMQLMEVYGFDQEKFDLVKENVYADSSLVTKLNVNTGSVEELKKHPYIKYNLANLIVNYRKQHGPYKSLYDLRKLDIVTEEVYRKIVPYLEL
ncbi:MAG TPA: helix-hairpin-helix domain-containing protein [Bacteroidia bacterium]|jgi:DNA uptake protein ComE-like DNA-binding protein